ncbi:MAG: HAD-IA family hydrolase [Propionibacteriaceae bacterium]|jgi:HAD superfamily hydrolase (TIGR01509 family)|nr:HAD-IA family hydrolase [Propionibacteriaceae bacterium]
MNQALIFDCDGVLCDTEQFGHLPAFNAMFREVGLPISWTPEQYAHLVTIGGGKERLLSVLTDDFCEAHGLPWHDRAEQARLVASWHAIKTRHYIELVESGALPPRPGVKRLAEAAAAAGYQLAVASTSAEPSVRAIADRVFGPELAAAFTICAGDIVAQKKPAPDIYLKALEALQVNPADAWAFEDSGIGLRAAIGAGLTTVVTPSPYTVNDDFTGAALVVSDLGEADAPLQLINDQRQAVDGPCVTLQTLERLK